jgi:hypothetical protein
VGVVRAQPPFGGASFATRLDIDVLTLRGPTVRVYVRIRRNRTQIETSNFPRDSANRAWSWLDDSCHPAWCRAFAVFQLDEIRVIVDYRILELKHKKV